MRPSASASWRWNNFNRALQRKAFSRFCISTGRSPSGSRCRGWRSSGALYVLRTAWLPDTQGKRAARNEVSAIKVIVPRLQNAVLDRSIQIFGAMGLTPDTPLSYLWTWGRALRFIDGPDEVHIRSVARREIKRAGETGGEALAHFLDGPGA